MAAQCVGFEPRASLHREFGKAAQDLAAQRELGRQLDDSLVAFCALRAEHPIDSPATPGGIDDIEANLDMAALRLSLAPELDANATARGSQCRASGKGQRICLEHIHDDQGIGAIDGICSDRNLAAFDSRAKSASV